MIKSEKKIYLVRHGQTDVNLARILQGGRVNASLNGTGRLQSDVFYQMYKDLPFQKIYTSTLLRSIQSVEKFIEAGVPYETLPELNEIDYGIMDGKISSEEENGLYYRLIKQWEAGQTDVKAEGGESPEEVKVRLLRFIELLRSRPEENLVLVSMHGRALRILLTAMLGYELKDMHLFPHQNFGLYVVNFDGKYFSIEKFNDCSHLKEKSEIQPF